VDAVARVVALVDAACTGEIAAGFALVRPPGHHVEDWGSPGGYSWFNNCAIAAAHAVKAHGMRVAIVDWDIHHGNGAQRIFWQSDQVLTISLHKRTSTQALDGATGEVRPSPESCDDKMGAGPGLGFNINIPLGASKAVGDAEYLYAFDRVVLPALASFAPDLIMVAAGFDAGVADLPLPTGGYSITPRGFGQLLDKLLGSGCPRVVASLEGGYDIKGLAEGVEACVRAMLARQSGGAGGASAGGASGAGAGVDPETVDIVERVALRFNHWE